MTNPALLAAVIASPDDDLPRLVYADWLDENGQGARAEFIRAQCEEAAMPLYKCDSIYPGCTVFGNRVVGHNHKCPGYALERKQIALISGTNYYDWSGIPRTIETGSMLAYFRRGFVESFCGPLKYLLAHGPAICRDNPVERVAVVDVEPIHGSGNAGNKHWIGIRDLLLMLGNPEPPIIPAWVEAHAVWKMHPISDLALAALDAAVLEVVREKAAV